MAHLLECNIWCYNNKHEELGMPSQDIWVPHIFDLSEVVAVKQSPEEDEFIGKDKGAICLAGSWYTTDMDYQKLKNRFLESRKSPT